MAIKGENLSSVDYALLLKIVNKEPFLVEENTIEKLKRLGYLDSNGEATPLAKHLIWMDI